MTTPLNFGASYLGTAGEGTVPTWDGIYAGSVVNNDDPLGVGRLLLNIPQVLGNSVSSWAVPLGNYYQVPNNGDTVSVAFVGGDPAQPAWIGSLDLSPVIVAAGGTKTTYSTSAPSSPKVGDVWIELFIDGAGNVIQAAPQVWTFDPVHSTFSWVVQTATNGDNGGGVGSSKLGDGTVTGGTGGSIAIGTIQGLNIANATITGTNIGSATITGSNIGSGTITGSNIGSATITGANIASATITGGMIVSGSITGTQIASATITGSNIASATIAGTNIASGTITGSNIGSATIAGSNIATGTITAANIQNATITASQISATAGITGGQIASGTISATNIQSATITNVQIAGGTITGSNIGSSTITAANIAAATITSVQISNGTITTTQISNTANITGTQIATGTVAGSNIAAGTITASNIAASTITGGLIAANTITGGNIAAGTITASNIQSATITATQIASGTITSTQIAANTITAKNINLGNTTGGNPYFGGGDTTGWTAFASSGTAPAFVGVSTTGGFGYPYAGQVSAVAGSGFPGIAGTSFAVNAGDPVQVNGWFNTNAALQFTISYNNAGGGFVSQTVVNIPANTGVWQYAAINGNVAATAVTASLVVKISSGSTAGTEVFQATGLTVQTKLNGGILTAGSVTAAQIAAGTITANELAVTGSGVTNFNPYFAGGSAAGWSAFAGSVTASTSPPAGNNYYATAGKVTSDASQAYTGVSGNTFSCTAGNGVNLSAYVYATQTNMSLQVQWYNSSFGFVSQTFLSTPVTVNTWTYITWTATPPATAVIGIPIWQMNKSTAGNLANTDFFWVTGAYVLSSFDGGIINAGTINTAQLNATAINGMTITGNTITGATVTGSTINGGNINTTTLLENTNGSFYYGNGVPPSPTMTGASTGGAVPAGTWYAKVAYVNSSGTSVGSLASTGTVLTGTTSKLTITAPGNVGNATGYNVYLTNVNGGTTWLQNGSPIALNTAYVQTTSPVLSGTSAPTSATGIVNTGQLGTLAVTVGTATGTDQSGNQYLGGLSSYAFNFVGNPNTAVSINGSVIQFASSATLGGAWVNKGQVWGPSDGTIQLTPGSGGTNGGVAISAGSQNNNTLAIGPNTGTPTASTYGSQFYADTNQFLRYHNNTDSQNYALGQKFTQVINGSVATGGGYSTIATLTVGTLGTYRIQGVLAYSQSTSPSGSPRFRFDQGTATQGHAVGRFSSLGVPVVIDASPLTSSNTFAGGTISATEQIADFDYTVPITAGGTILIAGASTGSAYTVNFLNVIVTPL